MEGTVSDTELRERCNNNADYAEGYAAGWEAAQSQLKTLRAQREAALQACKDSKLLKYVAQDEIRAALGAGENSK